MVAGAGGVGGVSVFPGSQGQFSHVNTRASSLGMGDAEAAGEMPDQLSSGQTTRTSSSMAPWWQHGPRTLSQIPVIAGMVPDMAHGCSSGPDVTTPLGGSAGHSDRYGPGGGMTPRFHHGLRWGPRPQASVWLRW